MLRSKSSEHDDNIVHIDHALIIKKAKDLIRSRYVHDKHHVACVLSSKTRVYLGLHLDSHGFDMCAEPIALGQAVLAQDDGLQTIVSVYWNGEIDSEPVIVAPCGNCRQILSEHAPELGVLVTSDNKIVCVPAYELLPHAYVKPPTSGKKRSR